MTREWTPLDWQIEPLGPWHRPVTEPRLPAYRFSASWSDTMGLLETELRHLDVDGTVAIRVDVQRGAIRRDGMLKADARVKFPGIAISFTCRHGALTYATDAYDHWHANIRATALSLVALRAVDRYGISRTGEQYAGWRAIEGPRPDFRTVDEALAWLRAQPDLGHTDGVSPAALLRRAATVMHPDVDPDRARWDRLQSARTIINASGRP